MTDEEEKEDLHCYKKPGIYLGDIGAIQNKSPVLFDIENENSQDSSQNSTKNMLDLPRLDQFKFINDPYQQK